MIGMCGYVVDLRRSPGHPRIGTWLLLGACDGRVAAQFEFEDIRHVNGTGKRGISCENLPADYCAFAISSEGMRCVLGKYYAYDYVEGRRVTKFVCRSSGVFVPNMLNWVETHKCIKACGVERHSIGMTYSELLWQPKFMKRLCCHSCYYECPNIVDLFFNLALGEGQYLPRLCRRHRGKHEPVQGSSTTRPGASPIEAPMAPTLTPPAESPIMIEDPSPVKEEPYYATPPGGGLGTPSTAPSPIFLEEPYFSPPQPTSCTSSTSPTIAPTPIYVGEPYYPPISAP
ncbi:hypothetical protein Sjap_004274 [Stephania japonica]|uniref:Uncharacterized protein n=1 Tax=Stephania japonica TaxID=461633 RepID=A0AAP0PKS3_9MAGN